MGVYSGQTDPLFRKVDPSQFRGLSNCFRILISNLIRDIGLSILRLHSGQVLLSTTRSGLGEVPPSDPIMYKAKR